MAIGYGRRRGSNRNSNSGREEKINFGCKRHFVAFCNHKLGENRGLMAIYDKANLDDYEIKQGNLEELNLNALKDILEGIPNNDVELLDIKERVFVPDFMSYLINGDVTDLVENGRRLNGEDLDTDLVDLIDHVDTMLREKSRNINIRLYQYQPQDMKDASIEWSKAIFNDYIDNMANVSSTTSTKSKESAKPKSLEEQIAEASAAEDWDKVDRLLSIQERMTKQLEAQAKLKESSEEESQQEVEA